MVDSWLLSLVVLWNLPRPRPLSPFVDQHNLAWLGAGYKLRPRGEKLVLDLQKVEGKRRDCCLPKTEVAVYGPQTFEPLKPE